MRLHSGVLACFVLFGAAFPAQAEEASLAPYDLAATALSWRRVQLTWSAVDPLLATDLRLERRSSGLFAEIATLPLNATSYLDSSTSPSTAYQYRLRVNNNVVWSSSNTASATTPSYVAPNPTFTALSWRQVRLAWGAVTQEDPGELLVQRIHGGTSWTTIATLSNSMQAFTDSTVTPSTGYEYRIVLQWQTTFSTPSEVCGGMTPAFVAAQGLTAATQSSTEIQLAWTSVDSQATELSLERRQAGGGAFTTVATMPPTQLSIVDGGLQPATVYEYRLVARRDAFTSTPSNTATAGTAP